MLFVNSEEVALRFPRLVLPTRSDKSFPKKKERGKNKPLQTNLTAANQAISNQQQWRRHPSAAPPRRRLSPREPACADRRPPSTRGAITTSSGNSRRGDW